MPTTFCCAFLAILASAVACSASETTPVVGESERVYPLAPQNTEVRGIAWDESTEEPPRLRTLDQSGTVFTYKVGPEDQLELIDTLDLQTALTPRRLNHPRGLAVAVEANKPVLCFMDWSGSTTSIWRYEIDTGKATSIDLSLYMFGIGDREGLDIACEEGRLLVSYDASGHTDVNRRVQRGILRISWNEVWDEDGVLVQHLPDAGTEPSHGLTTMHWQDSDYLWATVGNDHIYCADLQTGRGLFFFDRPRSCGDSVSCWGMAFGQDALWVTENVPGVDCVHRVNVTKNVDAPYLGPTVPRHLVMTIQTEPEASSDKPGAAYHYYSRPSGNIAMPNQGIWPSTERITDLSDARDASIREIHLDPAGDTSSRQVLQCVEYPPSSSTTCSSRYEIDLWTNPYKKFVYPHRIDRNQRGLAGSNYLADDPTLYNMSDRATFDTFIQRVRTHIREKYSVEADMQNPYWAARNVVEYIQDRYYYPNRSKRKPATVDYDRGHYDANPANRKIDLSAEAYNKTQIIACSGTSVMVTAALRHLGFPARWLGTGTQRTADDWDDNGNGLLDAEETATCTNGHRYTQVWLGSHYGWICFDATPSKPAFNDYDVPPPLQPQWRYMTRCAAGHREPRRIVFNIGSECIKPLYREFEYDERLAIDNNCGGDQRYNLQARFEKYALWKSPRHRIDLKNVCFVNRVEVHPNKDHVVVTWELAGDWDRIPNATVSLFLQERTDSAQWQDTMPLVTTIAANACTATVNLSDRQGKPCRIVLRRDGDPETGGVSAPLALDARP